MFLIFLSFFVAVASGLMLVLWKSVPPSAFIGIHSNLYLAFGYALILVWLAVSIVAIVWKRRDKTPAVQNSERKTRDWVVLLFAVGTIIVIWLSWQRILTRLWPDSLGTNIGLPERGQMGDSYGGLNTLFTGLAFAGVAFSVYRQIKDNRIREMERRREDEDRNRENFEARFFKLSDTLRSHVNILKFADKNGKSAIASLLNDFFKEGNLVPQSQSAIERYGSMYAGYKNVLGPYFRLLYRIVKYADESTMKDKHEYVGIIRAEMGNAEVWLVALNGLTDYGRKFKPLIIKYHLLKHFEPRGDGYGVEDLVRKEYPPEAFKDTGSGKRTKEDKLWGDVLPEN